MITDPVTKTAKASFLIRLVWINAGTFPIRVRSLTVTASMRRPVDVKGKELALVLPFPHKQKGALHRGGTRQGRAKRAAGKP